MSGATKYQSFITRCVIRKAHLPTALTIGFGVPLSAVINGSFIRPSDSFRMNTRPRSVAARLKRVSSLIGPLDPEVDSDSRLSFRPLHLVS